MKLAGGLMLLGSVAIGKGVWAFGDQLLGNGNLCVVVGCLGFVLSVAATFAYGAFEAPEAT